MDNTIKRTSRESETRKENTQPKSWAPPSSLDAPPAPQGYAHRWIRTSVTGFEDTANVTKKLREGWEPVKATGHPEITMVAIEQERFKDNVVIGGLMLCKAPKELVEERNEYYSSQAKSQMHSVDNNLMRENDPRMPLFNERKTKVTFGKGT